MKMIFTLGLILIASTATHAQQQDRIDSKGLQQKSKISILRPPLRGQKDIRPKQFAGVEKAVFKNVDLSSTIRSLNRLTTGEREVFAVANLKPMTGILISTNQSSVGSSYAFRIEDEEYRGAMLFIKILKQKDGSSKYVGHVIRPGYSDVLKLQNANGRLFFAVEEAQRVVLD